MNKERIKIFLEKYGPDILSGLATVGVVLTGWLSGRAGTKIHETLSDGKERTKKEVVKDTAKYYILPAVSGIGTIASIWGSRKLSAAQLTSVVGALGYFAANKKELEKKVIPEEISESRVTAASKKIVSVEETGKGDQVCLDAIFGRWFRSSEQEVKKAIDIFNTDWKEMNRQCGYAGTNMNDLYSKLGIQTTHVGFQYGWSSECTDRDILVNYSIINLDNGMGDVIVIEPAYDEFPYPSWYEY